ncbi:MAG: phosphate-binding protein [Bradyrhizobiaceae bacterium PARB1]|jgi:phosphate transport system substrate-binding protein|nr:MAG: phosphate-binding protein [Bradyrhizobiaceae bacterium PARB1]
MKQTLPLLAFLIGLSGAQAQDAKSKPTTVVKDASYLLPDGRLALHGDEALAPVTDALNAKFAETHPGFKFAPVLKGSATALPALAAGATAIGFVVGEATRSDVRAFKAINKHDPLAIKIGYAGHGSRAGGRTPPAVYVHSSNPLQGLTMTQLASLFTSGSPGGDINTWSQLGVAGSWGNRRIHLYGQRDDGDFSTSLRLARLGGMPFAGHYEPLADDAAALQAVAQDPYGIAIVDWLDAKPRDGVRVIPLASDAGKPFAKPDKTDVARGAYPLTPAITLYMARPNKQLEPWIRDYLTMALSDEGQAIIARFADDATGFLPLSASDLQVEREKAKD